MFTLSWDNPFVSTSNSKQMLSSIVFNRCVRIVPELTAYLRIASDRLEHF